MANAFNNPIVLDTDIANYRTAASVSIGLRVTKLMLVVGNSAASAGSITITNPENSQSLYPIIGVAASAAANSILVNDSPNGQATLAWPNFAVTGLTATGTKLYLWFGL